MIIDPRARLRVLYDDRTPFGSAVTGRTDEVLRASCPKIVDLYASHGISEVVKRGPALLAESAGLARYFTGTTRLAPEFLWPDARLVTPCALAVSLDGGPAAQISLTPALARDLARWLGEWQLDARRPSAAEPVQLYDVLASIGALVEPPASDASPELGDVTFVGHACVRFRTDDGGSVLFDPWLHPKSPAHPAQYQPLGPHDLGPVHAVALTHAHPDHFDLGTLFRFGADIPLIIPRVDRESVLTVDIALRLRELGFTDVRPLGWGESLAIGGLTIEALPFYGEQPAVDEVLHPEVRNMGNVYRVAAPYGQFALTVDSGRDPLGDVRTVARAARTAHGPLDVVFSGCRGFALYPVHYLFSSVARYLPFVPRELWHQRQKIMNDADDALDVAELWGARKMVPYADGGAPWYWQLGLGPCLDGTRAPIPAVDPAPEHALHAAMNRSGSSAGAIASPVEVMIMRPNDRLQDLRLESAPWPYPALRV